VSYSARSSGIFGGHFSCISTGDKGCACISDGPLYYSAPASAAWPTQYLAIYIPVRVKRRVVVRKLGIANGATASGNLDLGLYDAIGTRLVSAGSTAQSGTTTEQVIDITDTIIGPGLYYLAACMDGTTGTTARYAPTAPYLCSIGVLTEAVGSVTLPATATWTVNQTLAYYPILYAFTGTTVA
jgi:hypothetical protein